MFIGIDDEVWCMVVAVGAARHEAWVGVEMIVDDSVETPDGSFCI
jgi:hypothetical protein